MKCKMDRWHGQSGGQSLHLREFSELGSPQERQVLDYEPDKVRSRNTLPEGVVNQVGVG